MFPPKKDTINNVHYNNKKRGKRKLETIPVKTWPHKKRKTKITYTWYMLVIKFPVALQGISSRRTEKKKESRNVLC